MAVIYCFGDSITYGAWDIEKGGWSTRLRNYFDDIQLKDHTKYFLCYNQGIPGETTDGLVKRFKVELDAREREGEDGVFIFAFGANDSVYLPDKKEFKVSKETFKFNLNSIISLAKGVSNKIFILNVTPVNEVVCASRYGAKNKVRLNSYIQEYNQIIAGIAKENGISLVDVYDPYIRADFNTCLSEDGLHPNEKGHQLIFEKVREAVGEIE